jgi:transposase-like protein
MKCTTGWSNRHWQWGAVVHWVASTGLIVMAVMGTPVESSEGWVTCAPELVIIRSQRQKAGRRIGFSDPGWRAGWAWTGRSWRVAAVRSGALLLLVFLSDRWEWYGLGLLPWGEWCWRGIGVAWLPLGRQPWYRAISRLWVLTHRLALIGLTLLWLAQHLATLERGVPYGLSAAGLGLGAVRSGPKVEVTQDKEGMYQVQLSGEFTLQLNGQVEFYKRLLIIFLYLLEVEGEHRGSRRTRDGRVPFVRQQQLAAWFDIPHPCISRWMNYWLKQDWRRLLSRRQSDVLRLEVQQRIINSWVQFPWWGAQRLWEHLQAQGEKIPLSHVRQAARESGWSILRERLVAVYEVTVESLQPRDEWLVKQLLAQVQHLVERLEEVGGLTPERRIALLDLETLGEELDLRPAVTRQPLPWVFQLEQRLFGQWQRVDDGSVHCTYCGTTDVSRKSRQGRLKRYVDEQGKSQSVEVTRYYCHNPKCEYKSFTHLPANLIPYSQRTLTHHLAALQAYEWSRSVYRRTGQLLGVSKMTAYRWVSGLGYRLLPVAALFGVVRSSGVVGIDEKYVLVPKNAKAEAKMKRWMYVYFAVDCYTYDLLHIEIYPYNTKESAQAFLLALRAKGYHPRVVVTDLRVDYSDLVGHIFPQAVHHECIFHALQQVREHIRESFGPDYARTHPELCGLKEEIDAIFDARTKRTAQRRCQKVLAQRDTFVASTPEAEVVFVFLEHHWPRLVNSIESRHIPTTNNAAEQVIRLFTQHYKTFCGFESLESARLYLGVFEKVYRFTPFSDDAQERIRAKCPLELAGYEIKILPMAQLFRGLTLQWSAAAFEELVPNV